MTEARTSIALFRFVKLFSEVRAHGEVNED
jgi:hypothetical protein